MALSLRLRRAFSLSSSLLRPLSAVTAANFSSSSLPLSKPFVSPSLLPNNSSVAVVSVVQSRSFHASSASLDRRSDGGEDRKISPDEILFEGCDYNHWLITMDFPKDPKPTPEEMVETYVQTCAKVVGSVEEAKNRMYACSTTTYHGFQVVVTEEMSEKFKGLPGVVFVLPDSYIDPVNKEYGGDKYENGVITPRPPPIQYGRQGRYGDRNRNYDRPRYDRQREPMPMQQGNSQGPMQGDGRNYAPQQNYGQPGQDGRGYGPQGGRDFGPPVQDGRGYGPQGGRDFGPPGQDGRGYNPQGGRDFGPPGQGERRDYGPPRGREFAAGGRDGYQGERRDPMPSNQRDFNQGERGNFAPQERRDFPQGQGGNYGYGGGPGASSYGTGSGPSYSGDFRQGSAPGYGGDNRQGPNMGYGGDDRQGAGSGFGPDYRQGSGPGYGQS